MQRGYDNSFEQQEILTSCKLSISKQNKSMHGSPDPALPLKLKELHAWLPRDLGTNHPNTFWSLPEVCIEAHLSQS